jgi:hypothetical protein
LNHFVEIRWIVNDHVVCPFPGARLDGLLDARVLDVVVEGEGQDDACRRLLPDPALR